MENLANTAFHLHFSALDTSLRTDATKTANPLLLVCSCAASSLCMVLLFHFHQVMI